MDASARKDSLMNTGACLSSLMVTGARKDSLMITGACQSSCCGQLNSVAQFPQLVLLV